MSTTISVDNLEEAIEQELTLYSQNVIDAVKKIAKESMDDLVRETKATAPVGTRKKHYKNSIKSKKLSESDRSITYVWYVEGNDYRLTHLLEWGHALRNGGRYAGTKFVTKASEAILEAYEKAVEEACENG